MGQINFLYDRRSMMWAWKLLITLLLINYQIVVIIFKDFVLFKFLRDVVLLYLLFYTFVKHGGITRKHMIIGAVLGVFFIVASVLTDGVGSLIVCVRRYFFPLGILIAARFQKGMNRKGYLELIRYYFNLCAVLALWGVFQAHVLGDQFLMKMGYPVIYSYGYQRETLNMSYYFGNFGIQRVTATVSNSNVFAIILGMAILLAFINHKEILRRKLDWAKFVAILLGYVLTVSRSNFIAMLAVGVLVLWQVIPYKKHILIAVGVCVVAFFGVYLLQGENGITHKLVNWIINSLTFKESSAAGRSSFWAKAWEGIAANPLGIGFGKAGTAATTSGSEMKYVCENSYLAMGLDLGWGGVLAYLAVYGKLFYEMILARRRKLWPVMGRLAIAMLAYFMVVCIFSNHIYDMEAVSIVYLFAGVSLNVLYRVNAINNTQTEQVKMGKIQKIYQKISRIPTKIYSEIQKRNFRSYGKYCVLHRPMYLVGANRISVGNNFTAAPGVRLEAWEALGEQRFSPSIEIGENVYINHNTHIGAIERVWIGNGVLIGSNVLITDHNHGGTDTVQEAMSRPGTWPLTTKGPVIIEDHVWVGENACIMPGVRVGQGAVIGCNAVVTKDVPPYAIVGGVPAKIIKYRFEPETIEELLKIDYSKLDLESMSTHEVDLYQKLESKDQLSWIPQKKG